ncbi:MAG: hypothetical protein GX950_02385 [Candidatus Diapherotrites archaeon]|jgi:hypothetical protein|uniref:Uncharacterized protein n=1 Tax=Candidatus Iainarchaeum sp. TaxID=3101447 RepID=A0A7K4BZD9_9ARCH|nr:hypothetical protein [Candidatus Diapherotrites archaeon]
MTLDNKLDKKIEIKSLIQPKTKLDKVDPKEKEIKKKILSDAEKWLKKKQNFLKLSQITLTLDKYGDIFSDFDPRSYIERALSIDFLSEIRRASREKPNGVIELKMLIPKKVRNQKDEALIIKRLKNHFKRHFERLQSDVKRLKKVGALMVGIGFLIGVLVVLVLENVTHNVDHSMFFQNPLLWLVMIFPSVILVLMEPASWFLIWEGMNKLVFDWRVKQPDLEFYEKMTKCDIVFEEY